MKKTTFAGLSLALLLIFSLLASCATTSGSSEEPVQGVSPITKEEVEIIEDFIQKWKDDNLSYVIDSDGNMHLLVSIVFRANYADFAGLSEEILKSNALTLDHVAEILHTLTDYNVRIEGHANPTTPPGPQRVREEPELLRLSEQRALRVLDELSRKGVALDRKTVAGLGGTKAVYAYNDTVNNWKNRRVEFILYKRAN